MENDEREKQIVTEDFLSRNDVYNLLKSSSRFNYRSLLITHGKGNFVVISRRDTRNASAVKSI